MVDKDLPREWSPLLQSESDRWVRAGLITAEQRAAILKLYPAPGAGGRERTILIFTLLGSLLVGAGVILFFAANWPVLPAFVKVGAILAAVVGAYGSGYYLQYVRGSYPGLGHALIFLGSLFYGAGIWLVAQIFHLDTHFPAGFLYWGLGVLPVVAATRSIWVLYLGTFVLGVWTVSEQSYTLTYNWFFPVLMVGAVAPLARWVKSALAEAGVLFGLFVWFMIGVLSHLTNSSGNPEPFMVARMLLLFGGAVLTAGLARLGDERTYFGLGGAMALAGAYMLTFRWGFLGDDMRIPSLTAGTAFHNAGLAVLVGGMVAAAVVLWRRGGAERIGLAATAAAPVLAALSLQFLETVPRMVTFNLLLFAGTVGWIALGIRRRNQLVVNLGLAAFVVHTLTRYFDLFFNAMSKSLFFVVGGILLLGGGWLLERNRRRWMGEWGGGGDDK
ncbi:MAG TPA: DUF2157 domain-containing protein [Symbiobacteriaceae bacterium]|nr:DUF2157 domain-containing protein [Symbiobacteriaceae bacterium]